MYFFRLLVRFQKKSILEGVFDFFYSDSQLDQNFKPTGNLCGQFSLLGAVSRSYAAPPAPTYYPAYNSNARPCLSQLTVPASPFLAVGMDLFPRPWPVPHHKKKGWTSEELSRTCVNEINGEVDW